MYVLYFFNFGGDRDGLGLGSFLGNWRDNVRVLIVYIYIILDLVFCKVYILFLFIE